jgi:nitroimidazol reductase NimA-like FMN-containing flavoprotein (pyridoxamine 5'-phosphate oxidase superfamily)
MSEPKSFEKTKLNTVRQAAKRGHYDVESVYRILDSTLVGNVAFSMPEGPTIVPMLFARRDDLLLFHGSTKSRLMQMLSSGASICLSATMLDGLVLAKSVFHHSMNYRSVTVFGTGHEITDEQERVEALRILTDKVMAGRWGDARQPNRKEMKATCVAAVKLSSASVKIREGEPVEEPDDLDLPVWSGVIPLRQVASEPIPAASGAQCPSPEYLQRWLEQNR